MPTEILIYGEIGVDVTAADIKSQLGDAAGDEIIVRIDSFGGAVFQGLSIFQAFDAYEGKKSAVIESAAFSIASYIAMAFDRLEIAANGYLMIHNPSVMSEGDSDQLKRDAALLSKLRDSMVNAYSARTGMPREQVESLMAEETFIDADESLSMRFVSAVSPSLVLSRVNAKSQSLPGRVCASLFGDGSGGIKQPKEKANPMPEKQEPIAASVSEIKSVYPQASADFIVRCVERNLPIAQVSAEASKDLHSQNEQLSSEIESLKSEIEELKASAAAAVEAQEEAAAASAAADSTAPVARSTDAPTATARERWTSAVRACTE